MLDANGGNVGLTSHELGVPASTLSGWASARDRAAPSEVRDEKKADLSGLFRDELVAVFAAMGTKRQDATYAQLATAAGIFADKLMALEDTMPTQRLEHSGLAEAEARAARILTMIGTDAGDQIPKRASA